MIHKDCDPKCTGRCNKKRFSPVPTANKGCDPKCTGTCSKRNAWTSQIENLPPALPVENFPSDTSPIKNPPRTLTVKGYPPDTSPIEQKDNDFIKEIKNETQSKFLQPGDVLFIIMDLDGVILDIETVYQWVIEDLARKYDLPAGEVQHIIDMQDEVTAMKLCTDYNLPVSPQDFMIDFRSTSVKNLANTPLMPGIEKLMDYFTGRKIDVAVASTCNKESFKLKTQKHRNFFKKFSHIVLGGTDAEVDSRKPSPTIYKVCGSRFPSNPDPKRVLVLEDAPEGVVSAIAAQMNVVWFPNKYMNKENNLGALAVLDSTEAFDPQQFGLPPIKR